VLAKESFTLRADHIHKVAYFAHKIRIGLLRKYRTEGSSSYKRWGL
jgi:hypothetical protein